MRDLGAEELRRVQRWLVDHHGHALGIHALHDALDGASAEIFGVGLHRQAVHAHEVLAGAVGVHDGFDQVLEPRADVVADIEQI